MKKNTQILLIGLAIFAMSFLSYHLDLINPQIAYFFIAVSFVLIISPLVIYIFNKQN